MNGLNYLLQTNLYLALFMGFYVLVLRNETFFRQNRIYLNTSIFLSFIIPFLSTGWFRDLFITQKVRETAVMPSRQIYEVMVVGNAEDPVWTISNIVFWVYITGVLLFFIRFTLRLTALRTGLKPTAGAAFSFFNVLVIDRDLPEAATIIDHEKVHIRQFHSADIIFAELASIINWFNPVMYLYKKEIRHIHEFIADEEAASLMQSKSDYAALLFSNALGVAPNQLINNFFNKSLLKRRIIMLNKNKSARTGLWKYGFSAPLFVVMLIVSAATANPGSQSGRSIPLEDIVSARRINQAFAKSSSSLISDTQPSSASKTSANETSRIKAAPASADASQLKKYIQRNIKYPASAREQGVTGYVIVDFTVANKRITASEISKGLQKDLDEEVQRIFSLYKDAIDLPDNSYSIAIIYQLAGAENKDETLPALTLNNFLGHIIVTAMPGPARPVQNSVTVNNDDGTKDFTSVNVFPEFPGGIEKWVEYLSRSIRYPAEAKNNNIQGRVIMSFVVDKDGSLSNIKVLRGIGSGLDEEAVRVLNDSPKWKPGIKDGRPVKVAYTMPINFSLPPIPAEEIPAGQKNN